MLPTQIKHLNDIFESHDPLSLKHWDLRLIKSESCQSFIAWNSSTREALVIDPKLNDWDAYLKTQSELESYLWLGVIDTHTHADHISAAAKLAKHLNAPMFMNEHSQSSRISLKISSKDCALPSKAAPIHIFYTPGHTKDSIVVNWGPFLFTGDTVLNGDTGRDDLPGGDADSHFESLQKIKSFALPGMIFLPGHDSGGDTIGTWQTQLSKNASLTQTKEIFISESNAFEGPPPKLLKESLRENLK
jgi:sulfur dioxygenase